MVWFSSVYDVAGTGCALDIVHAWCAHVYVFVCVREFVGVTARPFHSSLGSGCVRVRVGGVRVCVCVDVVAGHHSPSAVRQSQIRTYSYTTHISANYIFYEEAHEWMNS